MVCGSVGEGRHTICRYAYQDGCLTGAHMLIFALAGDLIMDRKSEGTVFGLVLLGGVAFGFLAPIVTGFIIAMIHEDALTFAVIGVLSVVAIGIIRILVRSTFNQRLLVYDALTVTYGR